MNLSRGFDGEGHPVPTVDPDEIFFPDEQRPTEDPGESQEIALALAGNYIKGTLRVIYGVVRDGPSKKSAMRVAAVFRHLEIEQRSLREIAAELGVSLGNFSQQVTETGRKMNALSQSRKRDKSPEK